MGSNNYSDEGTVSGEKTITFPWNPREIQIINDSSVSLKYKFNASEPYRTLMIDETSTLKNINVTKLIISGTDANYRVWALG